MRPPTLLPREFRIPPGEFITDPDFYKDVPADGDGFIGGDEALMARLREDASMWWPYLAYREIICWRDFGRGLLVFSQEARDHFCFPVEGWGMIADWFRFANEENFFKDWQEGGKKRIERKNEFRRVCKSWIRENLFSEFPNRKQCDRPGLTLDRWCGDDLVCLWLDDEEQLFKFFDKVAKGTISAEPYEDTSYVLAGWEKSRFELGMDIVRYLMKNPTAGQAKAFIELAGTEKREPGVKDSNFGDVFKTICTVKTWAADLGIALKSV